MTKEEFIDQVKAESPGVLAERYLQATNVAAFATPADYAAFQGRVAAQWAGIESVRLVGSGNWGFSLDPKNAFRSFSRGSDIDVAVISAQQFTYLWDCMRRIHRLRWHLLDTASRGRLRRSGENVYAGFVSPLWLPDINAADRITYRKKFNALSDASVGYRVVRMYFFKNLDEAIAYYERGFALAGR